MRQGDLFNDQVGSSWGEEFSRVVLRTASWYSSRCKLKWKLKSSSFSRPYFQLQASTIPTDGIGMLPTPRAVDIEGGVVRNVKNDGKGYYRTNTKGVRWGVKLRDVVESGLLNHLCNCHESEDFKLNPRFVAEMMGFPPNWTELPFLKSIEEAKK